jgi:outer membrane protein OmpA-like peptidoglycan-associated protein
MVQALCPCAVCARHIRTSEKHCPFCGSSVRFVLASKAAMRGRLANLRREVQAVFGASLLGAVTVSCVPEARSAQAPTQKSVLPLHDGAEGAARPGGAQEPSAIAPKPRDAGTTPPSASSDDAQPPSSLVAIYGSSSIAILKEVEYTQNSLLIDAEGERTLAALKDALDAFDCDILIHGHAGRDEAGAAEWLAKRRAELVRKRLIALGVDGKRLSVEARGATPLEVTSPRAPGRDRRVSFEFYAAANGSRRACEASDAHSDESAGSQEPTRAPEGP